MKISNKIYKLCKDNKTDAAIDLLFDYVDNLLTNKLYSDCDSFLENLNINKLNDDILIAALSITLPASYDLMYRKTFFNRVKDKLYQDYFKKNRKAS